MTGRFPQRGDWALGPQLSRRELMAGAGAAALATVAGRSGHAQSSQAPQADHTIRIAPISFEIAPDKVIKTTAYNGTVPGPMLRLKEGQPVAINVINESGYPNLIHWHGLFIPPGQDGAAEEGSPVIPPVGSLLYAFTPRPAGTRWYHSHAMAMTDLNRSTYTGEFGFLLVEPTAGDPSRYDREVALAAHHWDGMWVSMQTSGKARLLTTAWRSCTTPRRSAIACSGMASRSGYARASVFCSAC
jgi:FtsP/CotA-like multicopper oxidase with cupredoxin domain